MRLEQTGKRTVYAMAILAVLTAGMVVSTIVFMPVKDCGQSARIGDVMKLGGC